VESHAKDSLSIDVGQRLRSLREERSVSMRALARRSSLSANALSMIERGMTSPSVSTLHKLAGALEVPITAFFRQEPPRSNVVYRKANERTRIDLQAGMWEGLGGEAFVGRVEPFMMTLESGSSSGSGRGGGMIHTGYEFAYCIQGQLLYTLDDQHYLLSAGDSLMFVAQVPHHWFNPGPSTTQAIIVLAGFEESERPSEYHYSDTKEKPAEE
jgi:transcriptional regulator with XRE-family HTH domain